MTEQAAQGQTLVGIGHGPLIPTLFAGATVGLPAHRTATGSGVINMACLGLFGRPTHATAQFR